MREPQGLGVEREAMKWSGPVAITFVARDGTSEVAGMDANLVLTSGVERELGERMPLAPAAHLIAGDGKLPSAGSSVE